MSTPAPTSRLQRYSREEWLSYALEYLAQEGNAKLTIDRLVRALGITKGSFYWHFRDRQDFQRSVIEYWDTRFTQNVAERVEGMGGSPADRLWAIMEIVCRENLTRYEMAVRAWAAQDPQICARVCEVDKTRFRVVGRLFSEMGLDREETEMRTRWFVTYLSFESSLTSKLPKKRRLDYLRRLHALITAK